MRRAELATSVYFQRGLPQSTVLPFFMEGRESVISVALDPTKKFLLYEGKQKEAKEKCSVG